MLSLQGYLDLINDRNYKLDPIVQKWRDVFYGMSLHIDGICPYYVTLRDPGMGWVENNFRTIYPDRWGGFVYQYIFENKLFSRHPRESELTRQWRFSQYKPFTQEPFLKAIQVITGAIFQDSGFQVTLENKDDNDYIWGNNFEEKTLIGYVSERFQTTCEDPNGLYVVLPKEPYYATTTKKIEPDIWFVHSKDIKHKTKEEVIFTYGAYHWVVNKMGYFRFEKVEEQWVLHRDDAPHGGYYAHMLNELPICVAGGQWNNHGYYDSWLNAAKPLADEFAATKSAEQMVYKEASHPYIEEASVDCPSCTGGKIQYCTGCNSSSNNCSCEFDGINPNLSLMDCGKCGGEGIIARNPGERMITPPEKMDIPGIRITTPDVDLCKMHTENNKELMLDIFRALHLDYIQEAQSGKAKDKDMETRYQFLLKIATDLFDRLIPKMIKYITALRNVSGGAGVLVPTATPPLIIKPTQFQIKTEQDLLDQYQTATTSLLPDFLKAEQLKDTMDKLYGGNPLLLRKTSIIFQLDSGALKSEADWGATLLNGGKTYRDYQFHQNLPVILDQIAREKGQEFIIGAPFDSIKAEVDRLFALVSPPVIPIHDTIERANVDI